MSCIPDGELKRIIYLLDLMGRMWDEHGLHPKDCPELWLKAGISNVAEMSDETFRRILKTYRMKRDLVKKFTQKAAWLTEGGSPAKRSFPGSTPGAASP